jgi:hypothetical protein
VLFRPASGRGAVYYYGKHIHINALPGSSRAYSESSFSLRAIPIGEKGTAAPSKRPTVMPTQVSILAIYGIYTVQCTGLITFSVVYPPLFSSPRAHLRLRQRGRSRCRRRFLLSQLVRTSYLQSAPSTARVQLHDIDVFFLCTGAPSVRPTTDPTSVSGLKCRSYTISGRLTIRI